VMLGNQAELWEIALAAMKLRAVVIPATPLLGPADLRDRVERGRVRHALVRAEDTGKFDDVPGRYTRVSVGGATDGWQTYEDAYAASAEFTADGPTAADDPLMLYFTSGTTA
ncbi:AMP-binding protein, partial [Streptomyces sp. 4F14]|uniref:AMP-binding protein n=1 Tax=Streptomyces sp. 4F14 TaxID=3394380 RepID=UPI003A83C38E